MSCSNKSHEEKTNSLSTSTSQSNGIYKVGQEFSYSYKFSKRKEINLVNSKNQTPSINSDDTSLVKEIIMKVIRIERDSATKLHMKYFYPPQLVSSSSSIFENNELVWIHPPRRLFFKILELNPFPYIKKPIKIGAKWTWSLQIGSHYGDIRWKQWESTITNISNYEIVKDTMLMTGLGQLHCFVVNSEAKSELGTTSLISYFNKKHGFVNLDYTNIDGSKIVINLMKRKTIVIEHLSYHYKNKLANPLLATQK